VLTISNFVGMFSSPTGQTLILWAQGRRNVEPVTNFEVAMIIRYVILHPWN